MNYSQAFKDSFLVGGVQAFLDGGPGVAYLLVYNGTQPAIGGDPATGSTLLVTVALAKPASVFIAHKLALVQGDPAGDFISVQGAAQWARLMTAGDVWVCDGAVSGLDGAGDFKVSGTGNTSSSLLYAGARAILGLTRWG